MPKASPYKHPSKDFIYPEYTPEHTSSLRKTPKYLEIEHLSLSPDDQKRLNNLLEKENFAKYRTEVKSLAKEGYSFDNINFNLDAYVKGSHRWRTIHNKKNLGELATEIYQILPSTRKGIRFKIKHIKQAILNRKIPTIPVTSSEEISFLKKNVSFIPIEEAEDMHIKRYTHFILEKGGYSLDPDKGEWSELER